MPPRVPRLFAACLTITALAACSDGTGPGAGAPWAQVAAGDLFTCALAQDGAAWCWGAAVFGQLGDGNVTASGRPVPVAGGHTFNVLAAGSDHACGIDPAGKAWCWGLNDFDELGTTTGSCNATFRFAHCASEPIAVSGNHAFDSIVVAGYNSCALTSAGEAWCWGWNDHGQVGSGTVSVIIPTPTLVGGGRVFTSITLDISHACGVTAAGGLFCWGSNVHGQLGADTIQTPRCGTGAGFFCTLMPVAAATGFQVRNVSAGSTHTCIVTVSSDGYCWGSNQYGVLGNPGTLGGRTPVLVQAQVPLRRVSSGDDHTCAVAGGGVPVCWGVNTFGQLGQAPANEACPAFGSAEECRNTPAEVTGLPEQVVDISAGTSHTCALTLSGEIWCWGRGTEGQLGNGANTTSAMPVRVTSPR